MTDGPKNGRLTNTPDGGVHGVFTIAGRSDGPLTVVRWAQPNFERNAELKTIFPVPHSHAHLWAWESIEPISDDSTSPTEGPRGARGETAAGDRRVSANRSGNDGSITRFGWSVK